MFHFSSTLRNNKARESSSILQIGNKNRILENGSKEFGGKSLAQDRVVRQQSQQQKQQQMRPKIQGHFIV